MITKEWWK